MDTSNREATTTWMVGGIEIVEKSDGSSDIRRYIDGVAEVVLHKDAGGAITGPDDTRYLLRDHLGGVVGFVKDEAIDVDLGFDAWGCREGARLERHVHEHDELGHLYQDHRIDAQGVYRPPASG